MSKTNFVTFLLSHFAAAALAFACLSSLATPKPAIAQASKPTSAPANYQKLLTVADVESATGLKGLKLVPRGSTTGAGGDLNFGNADGSLLLMVQFGNADLFKQWKAQPDVYNSAVTGVGDEAFNGPKGGLSPYVLFFRKGSHSVGLSSFLDIDTMKPNAVPGSVALHRENHPFASLTFSEWTPRLDTSGQDEDQNPTQALVNAVTGR